MGILRKILKITRILIVSIILFVILLVVGAKIFENELASFAMKKMGNEIDAPVSIGKVSLIPLFSFPRFSAEINNLWIGDPKIPNSDTLFFVHSLKVGLDSWDLMKGIYTIEKVEISGLNFDYIIDKNGKSNIDFLLNTFVDTTSYTDTSHVIPIDTATAPLDLTIQKCKLENIRINYYDSLTNIASQVYLPEITIKAKTKNDIYKGESEGSFILSHCLFEDTKMDQMDMCSVFFELEYEDKNATIKKLLISSEGIDLDMDGTFNLSDPLSVEANLEANTLDFDILKKYIPDQYAYLFEGTKMGQMKSCIINLDLEYADEDATVKKLLVQSEGIDLDMNGTFRLSDTLTVDANIETITLDFDFLKTFIPNQYIKEYGILDIGGVADISASINGKYADSTLMPLVDADVKLKNISLQTNDYPEIKTLNLEARITNGEMPDMSEATFNITKLDIYTPESYAHLQGTIFGLQNPQYNISTDLDINLPEFESYIPDSLIKNPEGKILASIKTYGILPDTISGDFVEYFLNKSTLSINFKDVAALINDSLQIEAFNTDVNYSPQNSGSKRIDINKLYLKSEDLKLNLLNSSLTAILTGKVSDPLKMNSNFQSFRIQNGKNLLTGSADIKNFEAPEFEIKTNIKLDLNELMTFAPDSIIERMTGSISANIQTKGKIHPDSLDAQLFPLIFENSNFNLTCKNISLGFPDSVMNVDDLSARISLKNDKLKVDDFSATYNGLSVEMDSSIVQNIYKAVLLNQKEELYLKTHIKFGDIVFDDFKHLLSMSENPTSVDTSMDTGVLDEEQNWTYLMHGSASVNKVIMDSTTLEGYKINRLHLNDLSTLFKFTDSSYIVDQFKFKAFEGEIDNSFHYKKRPDGTQSVSSHNVIQNMNIRTLLRDLDNFGMDSLITYENLSGLLSTDLNMFLPIDDSVLIDKMMVSGDLTLEKGGVYNYGPAEEISKFTRIKELENIQFKTLRSNIFMFKKQALCSKNEYCQQCPGHSSFWNA